MKSETETNEMRDRVVNAIHEAESGSPEWQKLEAVEVALDWVLEDADRLDALIELYEAGE